MKRSLIVALSCFALTTAVVACEKEGGDEEKSEEESGPSADTWDDSAYEAGKAYSASLKFWMMGRCAQGDTMGHCAHFDDADNQRIIFWHGTDDAGTEEWKQGDIYTVNFTFEPSATNSLQKGNIDSVE